MFDYADRVPQGPALPTGTQTAVPWGVRRMVPYPHHIEPYARVVIHPITQVAAYLDASGRVMDLPKHGTSSGTNPPTATGGPDGRGPENPDQGNDTDQ